MDLVDYYRSHAAEFVQTRRISGRLATFPNREKALEWMQAPPLTSAHSLAGTEEITLVRGEPPPAGFERRDRELFESPPGFIVGPVMGGLLGAIDLRLPFFAAGSMALVNLAYGYFVLPESLPLNLRRKFHWRTANPLTSLNALMRLKGVGRLVAVVALSGLAQFVQPRVRHVDRDRSETGVPGGVHAILEVAETAVESKVRAGIGGEGAGGIDPVANVPCQELRGEVEGFDVQHPRPESTSRACDLRSRVSRRTHFAGRSRLTRSPAKRAGQTHSFAATFAFPVTRSSLA